MISILSITKVLVVVAILLVLTIIAVLFLKRKSISDDYPINTDIVPELLPMAKRLGDGMNVLMMVSKDGNLVLGRNTFENIRRTINVHGNEKLKNWFSEFDKDRTFWNNDDYKRKATEMIALLQKCGIHQLEDVVVAWNENCDRHYRHVGAIADGIMCKVISPCWIFEEEVVEKGEVREML